ncbi:MAG: flagellar hook protein FlgE [Desulfobacteraceae bacterium]|nr:flagellar hook protein FlgE [Desulfobacteraceae bacterium]
MIGSLYSGISGLNASSAAMSVIGDNIANVATTGFKSSNMSFSSMFSQSLGEATAKAAGSGVQIAAISENWTSGSFENTGNGTDLAISGKGLFVVVNDNNEQFFTRAGNFNFNSDGDLVNPAGLKVQGYQINDGGGLGALGDINIAGDNTYRNLDTTEMTIGLNLDASSDDGATFETTITVNDSLGNNILLTLNFTKQSGSNSWAVSAAIPADNPATQYAVIDDDGDPATATILNFDSTGQLTNIANPTITLALANGAVSPQTISLNLTDAGSTNGNVTGYPSATMMSAQRQDGYPAGILQNISVDGLGYVTGSYSNGQRINLYRLVLADFPSYQGLSKIGNNLYTASRASGQPSIAVVGEGRLGALTSSALELSNVDLASEFVKMITTQRAYQANSRVISTSDELLNELINLKR